MELVDSVGIRIADARRRLHAAGIAPDEADLDARLLAAHALGWDIVRLLTSADEPFPHGCSSAYESLVERRERREPLAYITGEREFWNRAFEVSPAVLVPRPETELVVEAALEVLSGPMQVADVGTGSGCLAITLACERDTIGVVATDCSEAALEVARRNARRYGVSSRVAFSQSDLLGGRREVFDVVVSNPPYVADSGRAALQPEVLGFEPAAALFGGDDGLDLVRRLLDTAPAHLAPAGWLIFEIGAGQADAVATLISRTGGLTMTAVRADLRNIPRVVVARRT